MPLFIECPFGHRLKVPSKHAGHRIVCPVCNQSLNVPPLSPPATLEATPRKQVPLPKRTKSKEQPVAPADAKTEGTPNNVPKEEPPPIQQEEIRDFDVGSEAVTQTQVSAAHERAEQSAAPASDAQPPKVEATESSRSEASVTIYPNAGRLSAEIPISEDTSPQPGKTKSGVIDPPQILEQSPIPSLLEIDEASPPPKEPPPDVDPFADFPLETRSDSADPILRIDEQLADSHFAEINSERDHRIAIFVLGFSSILVAIICAIPSFIDQYWARLIGIHAPDVWSYIVLLMSVIQIGIAIYAMRLPDWSTAWFAGIIATASASTYALGLALTMFASQEHQLVQSLGLLDEAFRWQAQPWCFFAMCLTLIVAFCYGRFSLRWFQQEKQLAASRF